MNCREFEEVWNDLLDARCEASGHVERGLEVHASACPQCRAVSDRYQLLRQAISSLRPPAPSLDRLYALTVPATPLTIPIVASKMAARPHRLRKPLAAAAAFALAWLGGNWWPSDEPACQPTPSLAPSIVPRQTLDLALAEATEATLDLAREASAPASRIGREMLNLGRLSTTGLDEPTTKPVNEPEATDEPEPAASGLFKSVGERVGERVGPISGSARHAFSFLLGPLDGPDVAPVPPGPNTL